jgi:hypothetical protein
MVICAELPNSILHKKQKVLFDQSVSGTSCELAVITGHVSGGVCTTDMEGGRDELPDHGDLELSEITEAQLSAKIGVGLWLQDRIGE